MNGGEEMEKYGSIPEENDKLDEVLDLFECEGLDSAETMRKRLREDPIYEEYFSTTKQQQYLHIMFDKLGIDLKDYLEENYSFRSTKLLFKTEISSLIEEFKDDYEDALYEHRTEGGLF